MRKLEPSQIRKILVISLSNIGDVILTFPVMDVLKTEMPQATLSVVVGPKAQSLFSGNPYLERVYIYNKKQSPFVTLPWIWSLRKEHFDLVVDLRNTAIPLMIAPKYRTPVWTAKSKSLHMKDKHLNRLGTVFPSLPPTARHRYALFIPPDDAAHVRQMRAAEMGEEHKYVVVAPGAADRAKRWTQEGFSEVCDWLAGIGLKVVLVGDAEDRKVAERIAQKMTNVCINWCGRLSLIQLAEVLKHSCLAIGNDSAPMHLASYLDRPVLTIFGPTDPQKYGPWSTKHSFIQGRTNDCRACRDPEHIKDHDCLQAVTSADVLKAITFTPQGVHFVPC